jgi:hypothetical protein
MVLCNMPKSVEKAGNPMFEGYAGLGFISAGGSEKAERYLGGQGKTAQTVTQLGVPKNARADMESAPTETSECPQSPYPLTSTPRGKPRGDPG